jgi:hypothetical protein
MAVGPEAIRGSAAVLSECARPQIPRSIHEGARDMARDIADTDAYVTSRREKKVECCSPTAQNLRKLAKLSPVVAPIPAL